MMNNAVTENDNIKLSLPVNAAYVSAARLTASSVANRLGFDIDEIEDIKAAVSEACTYIIKAISSGSGKDFSIVFNVRAEQLEIRINVGVALTLENLNDEMGLRMIQALMDEMCIQNTEDDELEIKMVKTHKTQLFE